MTTSPLEPLQTDIRAVKAGLEDARFDFPDVSELDLLIEVIANVAEGDRSRTNLLRRYFNI